MHHLAKSGGEQEQPNLEISYRHANGLIKQLSSQKWMQERNPPSNDQMHHLSHYQQTTIFHLRTGHCHLRSHLYCLGLSANTCCKHQTACAEQPHKPQSTKKAGTNSGHRKLHCRRGYGVPRNNLEKQFISSSPQTSRLLFLNGMLKKKKKKKLNNISKGGCLPFEI